MATKAKAARADLKQVEEAVAAGKETVEQVVKASTETYGQAVSMTKDQVEKASKSLMEGYDEMTSLSQKNVEAMVKAGNLWAKSAETIGKAYFNLAQVSAEASVEAAQAMFSAKTLKDVVDVQTGYTKASIDTFVAEGKKINDITVKAANEAIEPIQDQVNENIKTILKQPAA
jgi:phasin family protein